MLHGLKTIFILFISINACSQALVFPKDYFRWPVGNKPGIVANFGELREGHWHMGLDIRTDHAVNMPVYAAADGYIARISVHRFGYGQAIYINHPNGLTTVYGHLNKFYPLLDSIVKSAQYRQESWEIELNFLPEQIPVRKGQFIALSGSTGGSQGPHVHFEIRNTQTDKCLNPLFFSLPVKDDVAPVFTKLACYNGATSVYEQRAEVFPVRKKGKVFQTANGLIRTRFSSLRFSIGAYDCVSGSTSPNGIYSATLFLDGNIISRFSLDSLGYDQTEYVEAHVDYSYKARGGSYLQQLFKLPGDPGPVYDHLYGNGMIHLADTIIHRVKIEIRDINKNLSTLECNVQLIKLPPPIAQKRSSGLQLPENVNVFDQNDFEVYVPEHCLYDSVPVTFSRDERPVPGAVTANFRFCDPVIPFYGAINVRIKPGGNIPDGFRDNIVIRKTTANSVEYKRAEWQKGWLGAPFNEFGSYQAFIDSLPPVFSQPNWHDTVDLSNAKAIVVYAADNTGIRSFRAELDNRWLMFTNDKGSPWIYNFDANCSIGLHRLEITLTDLAGNKMKKEWWFKRYNYTPQKKIDTQRKRRTERNS